MRQAVMTALGNIEFRDVLKVEGFQAPGCAEDYFVTSVEKLVPLPDSMTFEQGALVEPTSVAVHSTGRPSAAERERGGLSLKGEKTYEETYFISRRYMIHPPYGSAPGSGRCGGPADIVIRCGKTGASMTPVPAPDTPAVSTVLPSGGGSGRGAAQVQL